MNAEQDQQEIMRRLRELEEENARLKQSSADQGERKLIVTEGEYKGHPLLTFEGSVRRFSLGLTKLRAIKEALPQIDSFLRQHSDGSESDNGDPKI